MRHVMILAAGALAYAGLSGCAGEDDSSGAPEEAAPGYTLGPVDGYDLPPADLERVAAGDMAPDFTALTSAGEAVTLSGYRGEKNVVLFFYRGHW